MLQFKEKHVKPFNMFWRGLMVAAVFATSGWTASVAHAQTVNFTQIVGGYTYSAQAVFSVSGGNLTVNLTNLGGAVSTNGQVLTGLFWNGATTAYGKGSVTPSAVFVDPGALAYSGSETAAQHWAYDNSGLPAGYTEGIGGSGLGSTFGNPDVFASGGTNPLLNGVDWGIVNGRVGNNVSGNETPFIDNSATFVLTGVQGNESPITKVRFQYGSALSEQSFQVNVPTTVPEPGSLALFLPGLAALGFNVRRRKRNA